MIVLGVDAAWTATGSSGVALVQRTATGGWRCRGVAPGYVAFVALAGGGTVAWEGPREGESGRATQGTAAGAEARAADRTAPALAEALEAAEVLAGGRPTIIAVDMPVSKEPIRGRRKADAEVARVFGAAGCSTHTPSGRRPGAVGRRLSEVCEAAGYSVATADTAAGTPNRLVEVYPHPALLVLLERSYRFPYKVGRAHRLWPQSDAHGRRAAVLASLHQILKALETRIGGIQSHLAGLPQPTEVTSLASLKRYEDAVDALVCCWVGMEYLEGRAEALGDEKAAIWVPAEARERARRAASTEGRP